MKMTLIPVCGLMAALIPVGPAFAKDTPKGHRTVKLGAAAVQVAAVAAKPVASVKASPPPERAWAGLDVTIVPFERDVIRAYVRNCLDKSKGLKPTGLPAGLAKETAWGWGKALPEDWRKRCVRGEVLPGAVHKHSHPLPPEIIVKLPPPPPGTILLAVNGTVLRIGYPTYEILDVFDVH